MNERVTVLNPLVGFDLLVFVCMRRMTENDKASSWCTAFELYHIVRSSYTVHQRPQNEMWSLLDMFTLMFVESFALFIIKTNKPTKTNNECYSKNKSMFCLILTEGRLFSLVSLFQAMLNVDHVGIDLLVLWGMMVNKCICKILLCCNILVDILHESMLCV